MLLKGCVGKRIFLMKNKFNNQKDPRKETYGFKSKHHPSQPKHLEAFEKDLLNIASTLKFRQIT